MAISGSGGWSGSDQLGHQEPPTPADFLFLMIWGLQAFQVGVALARIISLGQGGLTQKFLRLMRHGNNSLPAYNTGEETAELRC